MSVELLGKDYSGQYIDYSLPTSLEACATLTLAANTVVSTVVPDGFNRAFFSFFVGTNVMATYNGIDPAFPIASNTILQELNPGIRQVKSGQTLKFISDTASTVNIRYDKGQSV